MKLTAIRDFLAVVDKGSLRAAARHLGSGQPAISRNIRTLERELGVILFERGAKGVRLTPMGELFFARARGVQTELRRAQEELDQFRGKAHGRVTVAMSTVPQIALLPGALCSFRARFPDVFLDIVDAVFLNAEHDLRSGIIDCYVGAVPDLIDSEFTVEKLFDNTRVVAGRKGHPLRNSTTLKDLAEAEWITSFLTPKAEDELAPLFKQYRLPVPRAVVQVHSALAALLTLSSSDLLMLVPIQWTQTPLLRETLQIINIRESLSAPSISIVRRPALPLTPATEYFCDMMRREVAYLDKRRGK